MAKIINLIGKYFVSVFLGLILTTNITIAEPEIPKHLNLEQFHKIVKSSDFNFLEKMMFQNMIYQNAPALKKVGLLNLYDVENFLNELDCEDSEVYSNHALLVKSISESEFVWQELSFSGCSSLRDGLDKLQKSNWKNWKKEGWKQFYKSSNETLGMIKEKSERWNSEDFSHMGENSIYMIVVEKKEPLTIDIDGIEPVESYLMECHSMEQIPHTVPDTSFCIELLSQDKDS